MLNYDPCTIGCQAENVLFLEDTLQYSIHRK